MLDEDTEKVELIMVTFQVGSGKCCHFRGVFVATFGGIREARTYSGKCCHSNDFFSGFTLDS